MKKNPKFHNRRYYLHRILKQKFAIDSTKREVDIAPYERFSEIPVPDRYYIGQLIRMGYNIQLKLL